jgi:hypothetical protein
MNTTLTPADVSLGASDFHRHYSRPLFWGAIFAGAVAALALQIVLMMFGAGLGLAIYNPISNDSPVASFGAGAAVVQGLSAVIALWAGGWVAGRFLGRAGLKTGGLHGFMVWSLATVIAIIALSTGAGWALGDLSKIVGGGLSIAGKPAAAAGGLTEMAKNALDRNRSMLASFLDEGLANRPSGKTPADAIRAKRDIGFAVTRLFTASDAAMAENQKALITVLVDEQGMTEADARKMVEGWSASYEKLKADLDATKEAIAQRARELAEKTATALSILSLCYFAAFVLGAVFACLGGKHGGACASKRADSELLS